ncbi:MAG: 50S ribosomal protein L24 [Bacteroidales bacterium]|nr:50S ribosomal protein L24 [Bacteroidales bacterium]MDZ4204448.1 50S ribosomal protein L24 [Bacteroidales bacterium]
MTKKKLHIKKGDSVMVIAGDDRGKQGKVLEVDPGKERAIVEGIALVSKHTRPSAQNPKGGILKKESSVHISNLKPIDNSGKPARIGRKVDEKTGKSVRVSKKTGEVIK